MRVACLEVSQYGEQKHDWLGNPLTFLVGEQGKAVKDVRRQVQWQICSVKRSLLLPCEKRLQGGQRERGCTALCNNS